MTRKKWIMEWDETSKSKKIINIKSETNSSDVICIIPYNYCGNAEKEQAENSALIFNAPLLLESLQDLLSFMLMTFGDNNKLNKAKRKAQLAIRKAEGPKTATERRQLKDKREGK